MKADALECFRERVVQLKIQRQNTPLAKLEVPKLTDIKAGYKAFNGHVFSQAEADSYNAYNYDLKKHYELGNASALEFWLNQRALHFKCIIGNI